MVTECVESALVELYAEVGGPASGAALAAVGSLARHELGPRSDIDLVLLPDEPYPFTAEDGPEAFTTARPVLVSGRLLTWYGPAMVEAHAVLTGLAE